MKVSFPYMDNPVLYYKLLRWLGHEVIVPPRPTQKTIKMGVKYAPEFACFPLKVIMGTYMEVYEMGADTIITSGGQGPCRAGFYGRVHQKILDSSNIDLDIIIFDSPKDWRPFLRNVRKLQKGTSWLDFLLTIRAAYRLAHSLDRVEKFMHRQRAYTDTRIASQAWEDIKARYMKIKTSKEIPAVERWAKERLQRLDFAYPHPSNRIKIGIIGEIYVVMEGSTNNDIETMLNELGCEVERSHYVSEYVDSHLVPWRFKDHKHILDKGTPYLEIKIGGHAKRSLGHVVDFKERGFDGVIHLKPFGCLPEIVAQSIMDKVSRELDMPVLSLSVDEQLARANVQTRIEAFLDLIRQKRGVKVA